MLFFTLIIVDLSFYIYAFITPIFTINTTRNILFLDKNNESKITKQIWAKTITNIKDNNNTWYNIPKEIVFDTIDPITGKYKKDGYICYYIKGSEPSYELLLDINKSIAK